MIILGLYQKFYCFEESTLFKKFLHVELSLRIHIDGFECISIRYF